MWAEPMYKRVVLKLSGEALAGDAGYGIDQAMLNHVAEQVQDVRDLGIDVLVVVDKLSDCRVYHVFFLFCMLNFLYVYFILARIFSKYLRQPVRISCVPRLLSKVSSRRSPPACRCR